MCSRYELNVNPRDLARRFGIAEMPALPNRAEFRPTDKALIVTADHAAALRTWGIPAPWDSRPVFNARAERVTETDLFRPYLAGRCLVPATAYLEWRKDGRNKHRNRIFIGTDEEPATVFAFAGLADDTHFTIITCPAAGAIAHVHNRMPVILAQDDEAAWLDPATPMAKASRLLEPCRHPGLQAMEDATPPAQADLFD